jgi:hypothetical protein
MQQLADWYAYYVAHIYSYDFAFVNFGSVPPSLNASLLNSVGITSPGRFLVRDGALANLPEKVICMVDMNLGL